MNLLTNYVSQHAFECHETIIKFMSLLSNLISLWLSEMAETKINL